MADSYGAVVFVDNLVSILYLRCTPHADAVLLECEFRQSFNSLFEMHYAHYPSLRISEEERFNSLFEMHADGGVRQRG